MKFPSSFLFSQSNLQDYWDCPRRFYLKHIRQLAWPSIEAEPIEESEQFRKQGELFHKIVYQFLIGIVPEKISTMINEPVLTSWWDNFLATHAALVHTPGISLYPELTLAARVEGYPLLAKYDLLCLDQQGTATIYDWKTFRKHPRRENLAQKLQSKIYPFLVVQAWQALKCSTPICTHQVSMEYWFTNFPLQPEQFPYSQDKHQENLEFLSQLIQQITHKTATGEEENFNQTENTAHCLYCVYRSLCDRGVRAGSLDALLEGMEADESHAGASSLESFDFDQITEVEF